MNCLRGGDPMMRLCTEILVFPSHTHTYIHCLIGCELVALCLILKICLCQAYNYCLSWLEISLSVFRLKSCFLVWLLRPCLSRGRSRAPKRHDGWQKIYLFLIEGTCTLGPLGAKFFVVLFMPDSIITWLQCRVWERKSCLAEDQVCIFRSCLF